MFEQAIGRSARRVMRSGPTLFIEPLENRCLLSAGTLDASFGNNGIALVSASSTGTNADLFRATAIQPDGRIVAVGEALPAHGSDGFLAVMRFDADGSPDPFFNNGQVLTLGGVYGSAYAVALQSNGQIVVAGFQKYIGTDTEQPLIRRFNSDGSPDLNFGVSGFVTINTNGAGSFQTVNIESDGEIIAGGYIEPGGVGTPETTELVRVSSIGSVESESTGTVGTSSQALGIVSMAVLPSGQLLALSNAQAASPIGGTGYAPELIRYNADGSIDPTFGNNGYAIDYTAVNQTPEQLAVDSTGSVVYVLSQSSSGIQDQVGKYNINGQRLPTFGYYGTLSLDTVGAASGDLIVQADGDVVAVTTAAVSGSTTRWLASRFTPYGEPDRSFGNGSGQLQLPEGLYSTAASVALETDGSIILAGSDGTNFELAKLTAGARTDPGAIIKGVVFNDFNGNGILDSGETGLAGITVFIDAHDTGSYNNTDVTTTTAADGSYSFTGLPAGYYYLAIVLPTGAQITYQPPTAVASVGATTNANFGVGASGPANSIGGIVFNDANGNGIRDANETPLANWTVYIDVNNDGVLDSGDLTQLTDSNGRYLFTSLAPSGVVAYSVRVVPQSGYIYTIGNSAGVALAAGHSFPNINFGESQFSYFKGIVFNDVTGTGVYASSDPGLSGITLYDDVNNNGVFDSGEPSVVTGTGGFFQIGGFGPGTTIVREVLPAGYRVTTPVQGYLSALFTTNLGFSSTWIGNTTAPYTSASIAGTIYSDTNANGRHDAGESDTAGAFVYIDANNNGVYDSGEKSTATYSAGNYLFTGLKAGTYVVRQLLSAGLVQTQPANNQGQTVTVTATQAATGVDFGDAAISSLGTISGTVFNDILRTGTFGYGDAALTGRTIYIDSNNNGVLDPGETAITSNANGSYSFTNLPLGTYYVRQVLPTGWVQTAPAGGGAAVVNVSKAGGSFSASFGSYPILPTAVAGGPYTVGEGGSVTLNGAASSEAGGTIAKYEWDFNYVAANGFKVSAVGATPLFSAVGLDGPATRTIALRVTDTAGNTAIATSTVGITDVAPTATFTGSTVVLGSSATVSFSNANDPSPADIAAGFTYSYDFNNDGVYDLTTTAATATVPASYLTTAGAHTVTGKIADKDGGFTTYTATVQVNPATGQTQLTGTIIGTAGSYGNKGNTIAKAFDGSFTTYFDGPTASGDWAGLDLGSAKIITAVKYASRSGWASRMNGGTFQGSNSATFASGDVNLFIIPAGANPSSTVLTTATITNNGAFRYVRYISPANSYGDVAELQFFGTAPITLSQFTGTVIGTTGSYSNSGNTIAKAVDGSLATYFDGPTANGDWVGLDLGSSKTIRQISFAPRSGWASRMVGGVFQISTTANFSSGVTTIYTITTAPAAGTLTTVSLSSPVAARYVRYLSPNGSYGDVAEIAFFG